MYRLSLINVILGLLPSIITRLIHNNLRFESNIPQTLNLTLKVFHHWYKPHLTTLGPLTLGNRQTSSSPALTHPTNIQYLLQKVVPI
ncbi:hypothetical protein QL285_081557 [Trifolium repens]|nr:hypothetical protein QL285_081557 [Trifolium repens]